jgi:hypothetical protein
VLGGEVFRAESSLDDQLGRQRMMRAREDDDFFALRDFAVRRKERLIEPRAEIERELGDGRRLERAREPERLSRRFLGAVDAQVLPASRSRELLHQIVARSFADAHGEEPRA